MNTLASRVALVAEHTDPRGRALAVGRSLIAAGGLVVLLFSPDTALFDDLVWPPDGMRCSGVRAAALWCLAGSSDHGLLLSRVISIAVLLLVLSGFSPRWTCIPHWYVAFSLGVSSTTANGGESVAQIATVLLIPICLGDSRLWQWTSPTSPLPPAWRGSAAAALLATRGQLVVIYLTAVVSKLMDPFWRNGTALRNVAADPLFGFPHAVRQLLQPLFDAPPLLAAATWSVIGVQMLVVAGIVAPGRGRARIALVLGVCLHLAIGVLMNLLSFGLIMIGLLVIGLVPIRSRPPGT
ncbi:sporulation-delaying protein SdpB family protein [Lentzea sp. NPDC004782]|uniref:sporulation-delaying protein SdpB family protein n=1 Tax=Lentzea sp. NPDC004782 TaxID=3154458 RepID=UPI0033BC24E9